MAKRELAPGRWRMKGDETRPRGCKYPTPPCVLVLFQKRVRVFHRGFKHEKTDESTRPQAECFYCFRVFETPMKREALVFEITSPTKEN